MLENATAASDQEASSGEARPGSFGLTTPSNDLANPRAFWSDALRGVTIPWTLAASFWIGAVLMLTRLFFETSGRMADSDHVVGALVITVAVIATAETARPLRLINLAFGAWLVASPFLLDGETLLGALASVVLGIGLAALSLPRGRRSREHYAGWDRFVL